MVESLIKKEPENNSKDSTDHEKVVFTTSSNKKSQQILLQKESKEEFPSAEDLRSHDTRIISLLCQENDPNSQYSFKGLMRKLKIHQQSLSRALRRLQELDLIKKSAMGYNLSDGAKSLCLSTNITEEVFDKEKRNEFDSLIHMCIPITDSTNELIDTLAGKWFKELRWLNFAETENEKILNWSGHASSFQIRIRVIHDLIMIETDTHLVKDKTDAMISACKMVQHIIKIFQHKTGSLNPGCEIKTHGN